MLKQLVVFSAGFLGWGCSLPRPTVRLEELVPRRRRSGVSSAISQPVLTLHV